jgi:predicted AlkP superfamily phosphohydrolase/phosphomutase
MQLSANLTGREPSGIVPVDKRDMTLESVKEAISELKIPDGGKPCVDAVYTKEELYHGQRMGNLPDLFVVMQGYAYRPRDGDGGGNRIFSDPSEEWGGLYTGTHRREGIFLASGSCIRHSQIGEVTLLDITPTILYALGLPLLRDFDGRVLSECFKESFAKSRQIQWERTRVEDQGERYEINEEEEEAVKRRLKELGYL